MTKYDDISDLLISQGSFRLARITYATHQSFSAPDPDDYAWVLFTPVPKPVIWEFAPRNPAAFSYGDNPVEWVNSTQGKNALSALQNNSDVVENDFAQFCQKLMSINSFSKNMADTLLNSEDFISIARHWQENKLRQISAVIPFLKKAPI